MSTRICAIIPMHWSAMMGGAQLQGKYLFDELSKDNTLDLYYVTRKWNIKYRPKGYKLIKIPGAFNRFFAKLYIDSLFLLIILYKIKPDVIYQRVGCVYTGVAAFYAKLFDCKMVWHVAHDTDVMPLSEGKKLLFDIGFIEKLFINYGLRNSNAIIVQSRQQASLLNKYYKKSASAIIPNFFPAHSENYHKNKTITVVWVANIKKWKQPECFIQLVTDLNKLGIVANYIMIGKPSHDRVWQKKLENDISTIDNLSYLGEQSLEKVNSILSLSHLYVNTSRAEGFANTAIQAWQRKVVVVSLNSKFDNILDEQGIGYFAGSYNTLLNIVSSLIKNEKLLTELGSRSYEYVKQHHSFKNIQQVRNILDV